MKIQMELQESKYFLEAEDLICREFYDFYREKRTKVAKGINQYMLFEKAVNGLLETIKREYREAQGGVNIKGLGYICHVKTDKERKGVVKSLLQTPEINEVFQPHIFFDKQQDWYLYTKGTTPYKKRQDYKIYFDLIESYYSAKRFMAQLKDYNKRKNTR